MNPNQNNINGGQVNNQGVPNAQMPQQPAMPQQPVAPQQPTMPQQVVNNVSSPQPTTVVPTAMPQQQVVNNDEAKKSNPFIVIVLILALILFIFNMEKIEGYYNKYILKKSTQETKEPTSVETNKLISIGDNTSYNKVSNIKFYNFKKGDETNLLFTYEALEKINTPETLGIFIEIYDSKKMLIYKEEFLSKEILEKDTAKTYNLSLKSNIYDYYNNAYFVLVKTYKDEEKNATSSITCKKTVSLDTSIMDSEIKYNFKNNYLVGYNVTKEVKLPEGTESILDKNTNELLVEYNNVSKYIRSASYNNYKLTYDVDLEYGIEGFEPLYPKGIIDNVIKTEENNKEWNCE